jgi:ribonuclease-3 family protein
MVAASHMDIMSETGWLPPLSTGQKAGLLTEYKLLAFIGDSYFSLITRMIVSSTPSLSPRRVQETCAYFVSASFQAKILDSLGSELTDEEKDLVRRCRNYKNWTRGRSGNQLEYVKSSALECLFGKFFLENNETRPRRIFDLAAPLMREFLEETG